MEIRYLTQTTLDRARWDERLAEAYPALPYPTSWYLDAVAGGQWDALVSPDYRYLFPLPYRRTYRWLGPKRYFQPLFTQQLGLFAAEALSADVQAAFLRAIPGPFALSLHADSPDLGDWSPTPRPNYCLPLDADHTTLFKGYDKALRKRLRKARPAHHLRADALGPAELVALYRRMLHDKVGLKSRHYSLVQRLITVALAQQAGRIWSVHLDDGSLGAAGFFLHQRGRIINLFGSSTAVGYAAHSMHALLDALIERHAGQPGAVFDFEGSAIPSIARFFASFGSEERPYWHLAS